MNGLFSGGYQANSWKGVRVNGIDQNGTGTSQINFRGLEDLGGGNAGYFRIESDISFMNRDANRGILPTYAANNSTAGSTTLLKTTAGVQGTWANSEILGGLRGSFGDVAFGQIHNMGLLWIQSTAAPLQGTSFGGGYGMVLGADPTLTATRWANSFRYITPTVNGFTASYIQAFKQNSASVPVDADTKVAATTTSLGVGLNNQLGAQELGLKYANGPLTAAFVANKTSIDSFCASASSTQYVANTTSTSASTNPCYVSGGVLATGSVISTAQDNKQQSLAASYDLGMGLVASGAYQKTTLGAIGASMTDNQSARTANFYNLQYTSGVNTFFAAVGSVKETAALSSANGKTSKFVGAGYNYALSKNTALTARWESFTDDIQIIKGLQASTDYSSLQNTVSSNNTRTRSQIGLHMAF